ncbi:MAG TPA: fused MFS/spermidine synthase [Candidatus Angelobacter sp.]|nr:fused MFS/spermidine synthase [Candidatus Angelobacter sp.]
MKRARIANPVRQQVESASAAPLPGFAQLQFCFFLSGAAGLIYQVAWTKSLGLLFGYTAYSTATAIAVFMGGLALGSYFIGKRSELSGASVRVYAWLELGVGLTGALSLAGLALVRGIYLHLHPFMEASKFLLLGFRVLGATLVLGIPTFLMGGTFPVLMRSVVRRSQELARRAGRMYAVNTLGAVCGTLAAGFFLLPAIGLRLSVFVAVFLNFVAAAVACRIVPAHGGSELPAATRKKIATPIVSNNSGIDKRWLLVAFALVGFLGIAYEVAWTRMLATFIGSSTYSFTLILATFLLGIVLGSAIFERFFSRPRFITLRSFAWTQSGIALLALCFLFFYRELPAMIPAILRATNNSFAGMLFAQFAACALAILPVAILFGAAFPLVVSLFSGSAGAEQTGGVVGQAYAANTGGAIAGALLSGFVLLPAVGSFRLILLLAAGNALLAIGLWVSEQRRSWAVVAANGGILLVLAYVGWSNAFYGRTIAGFGALLYGNFHDQRLSVQEIADTEDVVFFEDGANATISVTRSDDYVALKTNGKVDASNLDISTQLLLGDLGTVFHSHPKRVLIVGLGGGMTASAVSRFPDVERIDCVEIEPAVLRAQPFLARLNRGVLSDPRFHLVFDDARNFLQTAKEPYDLIISEPSNPWIAGISALYTTEFYAALRQKLAPGGAFVQWVQAYGLAPEDFRMIVASAASHFAELSLWRSGGRDYLLLARTDKAAFSFERARKLWGEPELYQDFQTLHLTAPESWPVYFRLNDAQLRALSAGAQLNTDDRTRLEYNAPKRLLAESLTDELARYIASFRVGLTPNNVEPADLPSVRLAAAESALDQDDPRAAAWIAQVGEAAPPGRIDYLKGRLAVQQNHPQEAIELLKAAARRDTNQLDVINWLAKAQAEAGMLDAASDTLERILVLSPHDKNALRASVHLAQQRGEWDRAISFQVRLRDAESGVDAGSYCALGDLYLRKGDRAAAEQPLRDGLQWDAYAYLCHRDLGELLRANGRLAEAEAELDFVIAHFPEADPKTYASQALLYQAQGKRSQQEQVLAKGLRIFPDDGLLRKMSESVNRAATP